MSESPVELNSNSKSNLIEVQHVGVTAQGSSPFKRLLGKSSSSESENQVLNRTSYDLFMNETPMETTTTDYTSTDCSKLLYELRTVGNKTVEKSFNKTTPSKLQFQLYHRPSMYKRQKRSIHKAKSKTKKPNNRKKGKYRQKKGNNYSILERLRNSFANLNQSRVKRDVPEKPKMENKIFDDLPEPEMNFERKTLDDVRIGIYHFEHGCADYLRTTDSHPELVSIILADRATRYATRFWAEIFGTLHIGVTFLVTFLLQTYRFLLFTLVNTLLVGFLHMTSDYFVKPVLTVLFNGFLQPPMIFIYNILASMRDILLPIAETINNFVKPFATLGRSIRLIHIDNNTRKFAKNV